jgi:hypothetical protein
VLPSWVVIVAWRHPAGGYHEPTKMAADHRHPVRRGTQSPSTSSLSSSWVGNQGCRTLLWGVKTLIGVVALSVAAPFGVTAYAAAEQRGSATPTWGVVASQVSRHQPFEAWLALPEGSPPLQTTRIKLAEARGLRLWWATDATPCGDPPQPRPVLLNGATSGAVRVCGVTTLETPFRLVAIIEYAQSPRTQLVVSSAISIRPGWQIPAWLVAILSVIGGWIVGVLTPSIQASIEKWFGLKQSRVALLTYAARDVRPALKKLREDLEPYVSGRAPDKMERVSDKVSLSMVDPGSLVYRLLPDVEKAEYLKPFYALQHELRAFNGAVGQGRRENALTAARRVVPLVERLLGVADLETPEERAAKSEEKRT